MNGCSFTSWRVLFVGILADVVYDFLVFTAGSTVKNTGTDSTIGPATLVYTSYTAASPSFVTITRGTSNIVQAPMVNGVKTIVMVARVRPSGSSSDWAFLFDARSGLVAGWFSSNTM